MSDVVKFEERLSELMFYKQEIPDSLSERGYKLRRYFNCGKFNENMPFWNSKEFL